MLKNYFKIAGRSLLRKRVFSLVNIIGLSIGLVSVLIISTYIISELNFDSFHKDSDSIYRVIERTSGAEQPERDIAHVAGAIGAYVKNEIAGVESFVRVMQLGGLNMKYKDKEFEDDFVAVDSNFFEFFDFKLVSGTSEGVFQNPLSVVMSQTMARKYFGDEAPIGKLISTHLRGKDYTLEVTGIMEDMPQNSHLQFEMLFSISTADTFFDDFSSYYNQDWQTNSMVTYLKTNGLTDPDQVVERLNAGVQGNREILEGSTHQLYLQPLTEIHFNSAEIDGDLNFREGNLNYVYIFLCIGVLILAIAFTNYVNLSTIKATDRVKEIGLRRVVGANSRQLILQFVSESVFICFISLVIALTLLQFSEPLVVLIFGTNLLGHIYTVEFFSIFLSTVLSLGIVAGLYPALNVLRTKTVSALRNKVLGGSKQTFFKGVVLFQFITSLAMIVATLVVFNQLNYINHKDLGYEQEALAVIDISSNQARVNQEQILDGFLKDPSVINASITSRVPGEWKGYYEVTVEDEKSGQYSGIPYIGVDTNFLDVFEVELIEGRNFRSNSSDSLRVMINETMARQLGITKAENQIVDLTGVKMGAQELGLNASVSFEIIGIVKDFHFQSLRERIPPMMFGYKANPLQNIDYFVVKLFEKDMAATMERLKSVMKQFDSSPFGYNFLDDKLERYYVEDTRRGKLLFIASFIAVFIAFIGLFALVHFAIQKRLKELSIRKVLGASVQSLIVLLSTDYLKLLVIALVVAAPLSYWGLSNWLNEFAYRTPIHWWVFIMALMVCGIITAVTAIGQIGKAATRNPAEILRNE